MFSGPKKPKAWRWRGEDYIEYVEDRLEHDFHYGLDSSKIEKLGWKPEYPFEIWLKETVKWYQENVWWWQPLKVDRLVVDRSNQKLYGG